MTYDETYIFYEELLSQTNGFYTEFVDGVSYTVQNQINNTVKRIKSSTHRTQCSLARRGSILSFAPQAFLYENVVKPATHILYNTNTPIPL